MENKIVQMNIMFKNGCKESYFVKERIKDFITTMLIQASIGYESLDDGSLREIDEPIPAASYIYVPVYDCTGEKMIYEMVLDIMHIVTIH